MALKEITTGNCSGPSTNLLLNILFIPIRIPIPKLSTLTYSLNRDHNRLNLPDDHKFDKKGNDFVSHLNKIMPRIPRMRWGALTNLYPTNAKIEEMNRLLPHDKRWHLLFEEKDKVHVDGVTIRRKNLDSMS